MKPDDCSSFGELQNQPAYTFQGHVVLHPTTPNPATENALAHLQPILFGWKVIIWEAPNLQVSRQISKVVDEYLDDTRLNYF